jgi:hypothetical protein
MPHRSSVGAVRPGSPLPVRWVSWAVGIAGGGYRGRLTCSAVEVARIVSWVDVKLTLRCLARGHSWQLFDIFHGCLLSFGHYSTRRGQKPRG